MEGDSEPGLRTLAKGLQGSVCTATGGIGLGMLEGEKETDDQIVLPLTTLTSNLASPSLYPK